MSIIIVVDNPKKWQFNIPGIDVVSAKSYLTTQNFIDAKDLRVFNLCKSYKYQRMGYYVSLIAVARGHKAIPNVRTIQNMKSQAVIKIITDDLNQSIQKSLNHLHTNNFTLSIYFGKNIAAMYDKLSIQLFNLFQAPLLRAYFVKNNDEWQLQNISPIPASEIPHEHKVFVEKLAATYFSTRNFSVPQRSNNPYDMAILINKEEKDPPSNEKALLKFQKAAEKLGFNVDFITKDDYNKIGEYDALFIRETTRVNHHTFRFAQRAYEEGLVVIDDPISILRCSNKVYLAELLSHHSISTPKTVIIHHDNIDQAIDEIGFPCILKQPDSAFSRGVVKVTSKEEYNVELNKLFETSDLIIAQEFMPTEFDWRVGIIDNEPIFVCKYYMAKSHWQIYNWEKEDCSKCGKTETMIPEQAPRSVISIALKTANLIGDGFYGVDLKQIGNKCYIIEINDNPSVDFGLEDSIIKDTLYKKIMEVFYKRVQQKKARV
ncbi:MAG: glutathione synthase [Spirochaetes bacterium GWF1_31_7]|nr:MAG: glutathione synthase [Spirochaetes bacterium GWE1_32_154]OHD47189.1 MAG: glutathione synthase [Spirochaetes bacterium GWE2_31_10]OHD48922.1 MAG: glutathione synthase [Spirochaetes bacterium GWF1_31_7]OHD76564.1 MAG: glutathione synthase [Spirochaetes bacterium RIFOXYB1_FULL_32_8]HBD92627.1 RimK family alpha-L-glutamate ligase [Spirochaetia bacterium]